MANRGSNIAKGSGPQKSEFTYPPSKMLLVCGPKSETDPVILRLAEQGFLTLRHDPKHFCFDERAGTVLPTKDEQDGYAQVGQLQAGAACVDGGEYPVRFGRKRLKMAALANQRASEASGKFEEPYLFRFVTVSGDEELSFVQMLIENEHATKDPPTVLAAKLLRGKELHNMTDAKLGMLIKRGEEQVAILLKLNDIASELKPMIDRGEFPMALAARELTRFPRSEQPSVVKKLHDMGIKKGFALEEGLRRLRAGEPLVPPTDNTEGEGEESEENDDAAESTTSDKAKAKTSKPKPSSEDKGVFRPLPRGKLVKLAERLAEPAKEPEIEIPKKYQDAIDAAFMRGARVLAQRQLGKAPPGWGKLKAILEAKEDAAEGGQ